MGDTRVIRIGADDWEEFREVRLASLAESPGAFGSRYADWVHADEARWRARLTDVPLTLVARGPDGPLGVVSGMEADDGLELISMWVAPHVRGTGLARLLIRGVVDWALGLGRPLHLMVRDDNAAAIRAYEGAGFVDAGPPANWPDDVPLERRMTYVG